MNIVFRPTAEQAPTSGIEDVDDNFAPELNRLNTGADTISDDMVAASKQAADVEQPTIAKPVKKSTSSNSSSSDDGIFTILYSIVKKVTVVGAIYFVGYMNWSVAWLITPIVLAVTREYWRKTSDIKREIAKASAVANEKDVILARIDDLPAWVYNKCQFSNRITI